MAVLHCLSVNMAGLLSGNKTRTGEQNRGRRRFTPVVPRFVPRFCSGCRRTVAHQYGREKAAFPMKKGAHRMLVNALGRYVGGAGGI